MRSLPTALAALLALHLGCGVTSLGGDPCLHVTCSGHGTCVVVEDRPVCSCDPGFQDDGQGRCVGSPCLPNPCTEPQRTVCRSSGSTAICSCDPGLREDVLGRCTLADPCLPNPCTESHRTWCTASGATAACSCDPGYQDQGTCVPATSCTPNPCTQPLRTVCAPLQGSVVCGCDPGYRDDGRGGCTLLDPCLPNPCAETHRTVCTPSNGAAVCSCESGYWDEGGICAPALSCSPNPCTTPHQTACAVEAQAVVCRCDPGYRDDGAGGCASIDPCKPNPCIGENRTVCRASGSVALCSCAPGFRDDGQGRCVDACLPNPCTAPHQSVCRTTSTGLACDCDPNYVSDGAGGCRFLPPANCPTAHEAGDAYEPDECQSMARVVTLPLTQSHTLAPVGDLDWLTFETEDGVGYTVQFTPDRGGEISARDAAGYLLGSATTVGEPTTLAFNPGAGRCFLLAKATGANPSTGYSLEVREFADAVGNTAAQATAIAGGTATSSLDYPTDEDWFSFSGKLDHIYRVTVSCPGRQADFQVLGVDQSSLASGDSATPVAIGALVSGTYFVRVFGTQTGSYTVKIEDLGLDDHGNTMSTATAVSLGSTSGTIGYVGDEDWLSFYAEASRIYVITLTATNQTTATLSSRYGAQGTLTTPRGTVQLAFRAPIAERYHLALKGTAPGSYTVKIEDRGYDDYSDLASMAKHIVPGTTVGTIDFGGDVDWFTFDTVPGRIYRVTVQSAGELEATLSNTPSGGWLQRDEGTHVVLSTLASSTTHYVAVYGRGTLSSYSLTLEDLGFDDHSNTATGATVLAVGVPTPGVLELASDVDVFSLTTVPGRSYQARVRSTPALMLQILDSSGTWGAYSSTNDPVVFGASSVGPYFFKVSRFSTLPVQGKYLLEVVEQGDDDHSDNASTPTLIPLGTLSGGVINHPADEDWFAFDGVAGRFYSVEAIPYGCVVTVRVLSTDGTEITDRSGADQLTLQLKARASGRHYVRVYGVDGTMGPYFLRVSDLGPDDHADLTDLFTAATPLSLDTPASGAIQIATDSDWFQIQSSAGHIYRFTVTPVNFLAWVSGGNTSQHSNQRMVLTLRAKTAGAFYLGVGSDQGLGSYTVLVEDLGTDDLGDTLATATPLVVGSAATTGAIQFTGDVDVFSFVVTAPTTLKATTTGIVSTIKLTDISGLGLAKGFGPGTLTLNLPYPGTYYLHVSSTSLGTYSVQVGP